MIPVRVTERGFNPGTLHGVVTKKYVLFGWILSASLSKEPVAVMIDLYGND